MKRLLRNIGIALIATAATGGSVWLLRGSELTRCHTVDVEGVTSVDPVEIRHLANVGIGLPLVSVDLDAVVAGVERHPWVAHADVRRAFPDRVVIHVQERVATALLLLDKLYLVDEAGNIFRQAKDVSLDLPVITGIPSSYADEQPDLARRIVQDSLTILARSAEASGQIQQKDISEVRFDARAGYMVMLRNGGEVLLGFAPDDALSRLARLAHPGVDLATPHRIDLGSPRLAVVTPL